MDDLAGAGGDVAPEDDDLELELIEAEEIAVDNDSRTLDDALRDEIPGIDEERRVDVADDRQQAATTEE